MPFWLSKTPWTTTAGYTGREGPSLDGTARPWCPLTKVPFRRLRFSAPLNTARGDGPPGRFTGSPDAGSMS